MNKQKGIAQYSINWSKGCEAMRGSDWICIRQTKYELWGLCCKSQDA